jgi:oligopeptide/dipeptide ABC transporter ATP-binding protein
LTLAATGCGQVLPPPGLQRPLFTVDNLAVSFGARPGGARIVDGVSFTVEAGQTLGIVGESGCGKSVMAMSSIRLQASPPSHIESGQLQLDELDLTGMSRAALRDVWGRRIGVVFQDPMTSLNPTFTIGDQLHESLSLHETMSRVEARQRVLHMLDRVGVNAPERRLQQYPHELSGGLRQRVLIAMALICKPQLLIADEPTTALDVTLQAQILDLLRGLRDELGMGILIITHDLGVVAGFCDRVSVMYSGRIVESAPVDSLFTAPLHPYTFGLLASIPRLSTQRGVRLPVIEGRVPAAADRPPGCAFGPRCPRASDICRASPPSLVGDIRGHQIACYHPMECV